MVHVISTYGVDILYDRGYQPKIQHHNCRGLCGKDGFRRPATRLRSEWAQRALVAGMKNRLERHLSGSCPT